MKLVLKVYKPHLFGVITVIALVLARAMSELALPRFLGLIVDQGIARSDTAFILKTGFFMLLVNLLGMVASFGSAYLSSKISTEVGSSLRCRLFERISEYTPSDINTFGTASLITRVTNDVNQVQNLSMMSLRLMIMAPLMMTGGIIMALSQDIKLSAVLLVALPVIAVMVTVFGRISLPMFTSMQTKTDGLARVVRENLSGLRVIRAFNKRAREEERFAKANRELTDLSLRTVRLMGLLMPLMSLLLNTAVISVLWLGAKRINMGTLQIGSLLAFIQYISQILFSLLMVSMLFISIPQAMVSVRRIGEVIETEPGIKNRKELASMPSVSDLEFSEVSMRYKGAESPAICDISFNCKKGEFLAIIGSTGSGKTTILSLIQRFFDAEKGSIKISGTDIKDISQEELRSLMAYVPQKTFLFSGTVNSNVAYGGKSELVTEAIETAQAADFVYKMEDGLGASVARGGTNLSGGQKQRLAIARALARNAPILLLDDSFSALDAATESRLRNALKEKTADKIVIMATQRIRSAMNADKIIVLDEGRIVGVGRHEELAAGNAVYRELAGTQLEEAIHE